MGRKHCGKRRNCSLRAISPFPTVFSKGLFPRGVKRCHCVGIRHRQLTLSQTSPVWFLRVCSTSLLKTLWEKKKLLVMSNFFFSHSVFHPSLEISAIFIKFEIVVCKLFQLGPIQKLLFGKGLRALVHECCISIL